MSYTSGLGDLQQVLTALGASEARTSGAEKTPKGSGAAEGATVSVTGAGGDSASVSASGGALLRSLGDSDVRTAKVAALREAIASGSYAVESDAVAGKLMTAMLGGN
jgi:flagellar biosynthesis anti-sigma factor FlgM